MLERSTTPSTRSTQRSLPAPATAASNYAKNTTNDAPDNIIQRRWLLIDCDPVRPANISASDDEKAAAKELVLEVRIHLSDCGWPDPVIADSGNGYHLLYRIELPNNDRST